MNLDYNTKYGYVSKKSFNSGNFNKFSESNIQKLVRKDSVINSKIGLSTDTISIMEHANVNNNLYNAHLNKKAYVRVKTYNVKYIKKWFEKNSLPSQSNNNLKYANIDFQSNNIIDQIKVLLDNMNYFKLQYLQGKEVKL